MSTVTPQQPPALNEAQSIAIAQQVGAAIARLPDPITIAPGDAETYRRVKESLPVLKRAERAWEALFEPIKSFYYAKWKAECAEESQHTKPIRKFFDAWSAEVYRWEQGERRRQHAEELQAAAERRRDEETRLLQEAEHLIDAGQPEIAAQVLEQAVSLPAVAPLVPVPSAVVAVDDMTSSEHWTWHYAGAPRDVRWTKLTDEQRRHVEAALPAAYRMADESAITRQVTATKSLTNIPGVVVYDKGKTTVRS